MKIVVTKRELDSALAVVSIALGPTSADDFTSHVLLRGVPSEDPNCVGRIEIVATTGKFVCKVPVVAQVDDGFPGFAVEGWRLRQWVQAAGDVSLEFEIISDGVVRAKGGRGYVRFRSFDGSKITQWEKHLGTPIRETSGIQASRLHTAFTYSKGFVGEDPRRQELTLVELARGCFWAADGHALVMVDIPPMREGSIRIHGKDIGAVLSFLGGCGDNPIKVSEYKHCTAFERDDGTFFAVAKPITLEMPEFEVDMDTPHTVWCDVSVADVKGALMSLTAGADRENRLVAFVPDRAAQTLVLRMKSAVSEDGAGVEWNEVVVASSAMGGDEKEAFPPQGALLDRQYVLKVLGLPKREATIRLAFRVIVDEKNPRRRGGYMEVLDRLGEDRYLSTVRWSSRSEL